MDLQELIDKAKEAKQKGALKVALFHYNEAFDMLTKEADEYARKQNGAVVDEDGIRKIMPKLFEESKKYLKDDPIAATISNNMGVIFAEMNEYKEAEKFFNQSIELTPDGMDYPDPVRNLAGLKK